METETHTCNCTACNGLTFTAPSGYVDRTSKHYTTLVHNYAQHAHGASPVSTAIRQRSGITPA